MTLLEIGKIIKKRRLELSYSKNRVANDLKLSSKYLQRIEEGTLEEISPPHNIVRYLKIYIQYFALDQKLVKSYQEYCDNKRDKRKKHEIIPFKFSIFNRDIVFSAIAIIILLNLFNWLISDNYQEEINEENITLYRN